MYVDRAGKDEPTLNTEEAEAYVKALMRMAARDCVQHSYKWRQYVPNTPEGPFWSGVSDDFKRKVAKVAGDKMYDKLTAAIAVNKNVRKAKEAITRSRCEDAVREALHDEKELHHEGAESGESSKPEPEEKMEEAKGTVRIDVGHPNVNVPSVTAKAEELSEAMGDSLVKAFAPKPNMHDFVPKTREELELYKSHGIVPKGFLDRKMVAQICPGLADEMKKAQMPLIREERFLSDIGKRVALDVHRNAEKYAQAILEHAPEMIEEFAKAEDAHEYDLYKAGDLTMDLIKAGKPGMVQKKVKVTRGGKTFYQMRWVREGGESTEEALKSREESEGGYGLKHRTQTEGVRAVAKQYGLNAEVSVRLHDQWKLGRSPDVARSVLQDHGVEGVPSSETVKKVWLAYKADVEADVKSYAEGMKSRERKQRRASGAEGENWSVSEAKARLAELHKETAKARKAGDKKAAARFHRQARRAMRIIQAAREKSGRGARRG